LAIRKYTPVTKTTKNPWQTHSIQEVYDNPWITVSHREVTAPTGKDGIYGMVHFKNTAVGVVPIDSEGNTWLVGQHRYTINAYAIGYVAQGLSFGSAEPDDTEILQLKKMPLSDAVDMAMQGLITDSLAMVSLLKVQLLIDRGDLTV
jgi:hypothetical protein